jgi:hypothetical protein
MQTAASELGVPTPAHDLAMQTVAAIARRDLQPGLEQLAHHA